MSMVYCSNQNIRLVVRLTGRTQWHLNSVKQCGRWEEKLMTCLTLVLCSTRVNFQLHFCFCNMYTFPIPLRKLTKTQLTRSI